MPIMCVPKECGVFVFVPKVDLTHILLAIDPILIADDMVG